MQMLAQGGGKDSPANRRSPRTGGQAAGIRQTARNAPNHVSASKLANEARQTQPRHLLAPRFPARRSRGPACLILRSQPDSGLAQRRSAYATRRRDKKPRRQRQLNQTSEGTKISKPPPAQPARPGRRGDRRVRRLLLPQPF